MASKRTGGSKESVASEFSRACDVADVIHAVGKTAVHRTYRDGIVVAKGHGHTHSSDFDECHRVEHPQEHRWDYGLGISCGKSELAIWVEAHPASSTGEVSVMLAKLAWLQGLLKVRKYKALRDMTAATVSAGFLAYRWLAQTGTITVTPGSKEAKRLAAAGLAAPRRIVQLP